MNITYDYWVHVIDTDYKQKGWKSYAEFTFVHFEVHYIAYIFIRSEIYMNAYVLCSPIKFNHVTTLINAAQNVLFSPNYN